MTLPSRRKRAWWQEPLLAVLAAWAFFCIVYGGVGREFDFVAYGMAVLAFVVALDTRWDRGSE